jgi:tripartite-type tricarboxylate transporter receptor subunit TctC
MKLKMMLLSAIFTLNVCAEPTTVILPVGSGGLIHKYALEMQPFFNKQLDGVVYELKPGAGGVIGAAALAENKTDKMVLLFGPVQNWPTNPLTDMIPVAYMGTIPGVIFSKPNTNYKDFKEVLNFAKTNNLSYGVPTASNNGKLIRHMAEKYSVSSNIVEVPYKSGGMITADTVGGHLNIGVSIPNVINQYVDEGKLVGLAVFAPQRSHYLPNVPTLRELGLSISQDYKYFNNIFLFANKSAKPQEVEKLRKAIAEYMRSNDSLEVRKKMDIHFGKQSITSPDNYIKEIISE